MVANFEVGDFTSVAYRHVMHILPRKFVPPFSSQTITNLDEFDGVHDALSKAGLSEICIQGPKEGSVRFDTLIYFDTFSTFVAMSGARGHRWCRCQKGWPRTCTSLRSLHVHAASCEMASCWGSSGQETAAETACRGSNNHLFTSLAETLAQISSHLLAACRFLIKRCALICSEASLMRTVLGQQKTTVAHISMLQELCALAISFVRWHVDNVDNVDNVETLQN